MGFLGELAGDLASIAIKGAMGYATSAPKVKEAAALLAKAEEQDGWVSAEAFLDAYDVRIYNLESDQHDIKIMKEHDFPGGYVLWNRTRDLYHVGVGSTVYKKVERHFRGFGNEAVFLDREAGDDFHVTLFRLDSTEYQDLLSLEKALRESYGSYPATTATQVGEQEEHQTGVGIFGLIRSIFR